MRTARAGACAVLAAGLLAVAAGPAVATNDMTITGVCMSYSLHYEVSLDNVGNTPDATLHPDTETPVTFEVDPADARFMAYGERWDLHSNGQQFVSNDKTEPVTGSTSCASSSPSTPKYTTVETKSIAVVNAWHAAEEGRTRASGYTAVAQAWNSYCAVEKGCTDTLPTSPAAYCTELGITGTGFELVGGYVC
ncbi:hypothetical protein [Candidatus Poriferisodalis sp.]|uniref:hypothetical protein n=1 Tax=Candidatus Poriferisodalis sp. TaxID=3101277 RepID=UPI003B5CD9D2